MFAKLCAVVVVLCLGATSFAETVTVEVGNITFDPAFALGQNWTFNSLSKAWTSKPGTSVFYFDLIVTDMSVPVNPDFGIPVMDLAAINVGVQLSGPGIEHLIANPTLTQFVAVDPAPPNASGVTDFAVMPATISDFGYAWGSTPSNSSANGLGTAQPADALMTFILAMDSGTNTLVAPGHVIARFFYAWDGTPIATPTITMLGANGVPGDAFVRSAAGVNSALIIPEPATMGLLGLGLVGLVARRRNKK